ncbi:MAG: endonuclease/exonuclease/phosphatase family protein [Candidatus Neomarinimicrobiota bacterium]
MVIVRCPGPAPPSSQNGAEGQQTWDIPAFGTDSTFEIMTWNLSNFGQRSPVPLHRVAEIVRDLDVDVVALQEIVSQAVFEALVDSLAGWSGYRASPTSPGQELAFLYKDSLFTVVTPPFEIYAAEDLAFPREPLVLELALDTVRIVAINNHLKCCGDGIIDDDPDDEEARRRTASLLLEDYLRTELPEQNVIVLGDLNDEIDDPEGENVFQNFIATDSLFFFVTMTLVEDSTQITYPQAPWFSFIDNILITASLFDEWEASGQVATMRLDDVMDDYLEVVSDHRPVALKLQIR